MRPWGFFEWTMIPLLSVFGTAGLALWIAVYANAPRFALWLWVSTALGLLLWSRWLWFR